MLFKLIQLHQRWMIDDWLMTVCRGYDSVGGSRTDRLHRQQSWGQLSCNLAPGTSAARVQCRAAIGASSSPSPSRNATTNCNSSTCSPRMRVATSANKWRQLAQGVASEYVLLQIDSKQWPESATVEKASVGLAAAAAAAAPPLQRLQQRWVVGARHRDAAASSQLVWRSRRRSPSARTY